MSNSNLDLSEQDEEVLDVLKSENRANPYLIREKTGFEKGEVNTALVRLSSRGWVKKVTRGLYEFQEDPRNDSEENLEEDFEEGFENSL